MSTLRSLGLFMIAIGVVAAWNTRSVHADYQDLLGSRLPRVELEDDGKLSVERKWDGAGDLSEVRWVDHGTSPVESEVLRITPFGTTRESYIGGHLWKRVREQMRSDIGRSGAKVLLKRETEWQSNPAKGLWDRLSVEYAKNNQWITDESERQSGSGEWRKMHSRSSELIAFDVHSIGAHSNPKTNPVNHLTPLASQRVKEYAACLKKAIPASVDGCLQELTALRQAGISETAMLDLTRFSHLKCEVSTGDTRLLWLPNGFRVDMRSCAGTKTQDFLEQAANGVVTQKLSCLREINPKLARRMALSIAEKSPILRCLGNPEQRQGVWDYCYEFDIDKENKKPDCVANTIALSENSFVEKSRPYDIFLKEADPSHPRFAFTAERVASVLFHESFHLLGRAGNFRHDYGFPSDEVNGCEALCSADPQRRNHTTQEGCHACFTSEKNIFDSKQVDRACSRFLPEKLYSRFLDVLTVKRALEDCNGAAAQPARGIACDRLSGNSMQALFCPTFPKRKCVPSKLAKAAYTSLRAISADPKFDADHLPITRSLHERNQSFLEKMSRGL